jgi:putative phosphoesterase
VQIAIISDTHMPRGGRRLPEECVERLRAADLIVHAGDLIAESVLEELNRYGNLVAVHGNVDEPSLRSILPERRTIDVGQIKVGIVHDAGASRGRMGRLREWFPDANAVVFGHSHIPLHECGSDGFQIFNPGSPTERRRAPRHTMGIATVGKAGIAFELIPLNAPPAPSTG